MLSDVVLDRPSKARRKLLPGFRVFGILRVLRGAENVPDRSFEAQQKQLVARRPRDALLCHGTSEAPQAVSIGRRKCYLARCSFRRPFAALPWVLPRPHELFLLGFETAIWHFRGATSCFYWASKLLSGTFSAPLKSFKTLKTLPAAFDGLRCFTMGPPEAPRAVSVGLRNCYLALPKRHKMFLFGFATGYLARCSFRRPFAALPWVLPRPHKLFLLGFETAIWHFRSATSCFYWASKLLSGTFSAPLKTFKGFKPSQQLSTAFRCFAIGFRNCYLATRRRHKLFLLGFKTAIWHVFSTPKTVKGLKPSQQLSTAFRCFAMGPPEAPRTVSVGLRNCYLALPKRHKLFLYWASKLLSGTFSAPSKTLKTLPAAFDGLRCFAMGPPEAPSCFCWASKLLSGTSEAPQAVSIGLRNCYLARFQRPLKASKPSQQLSTAFRCFAMGPPEAPRAVSVGLRNCYLALPRRDKLFLLGFETAIWHVAAFDGLSLLCHGSSRGPTSCFCWASKLLSGTSEAPQAVSILGFETAIWHLFSTLKSLKTLKTLPAAFDGLSLLCHGSSRGPTSCFCWASKLLSDTSEAPQAVSIGLRNCYLARFQHPLKASKPSKPSQQLSTVPWQSSRRPSKAAGRVLRVLEGAENVPDSSFEAQYRNSLWRFGSAR